MKLIIYLILYSTMALSLAGCRNGKSLSEVGNHDEWKSKVQEKVSEFGHRNWVLIVDKAFPAQTAEGILTIDTKMSLLDVLSFTLEQIDSSLHVKPIIYTDKEINFITEDQVSGIKEYKNSLDEIIGKYKPQVLLHDSVFVKIDRASELFKILILKTDEVIPYSSVFIELDCKYWSAGEERVLRDAMLNQSLSKE